MLFAVDFDDQPHRKAAEIGDIRTEGDLTPEMRANDRETMPEMLP